MILVTVREDRKRRWLGQERSVGNEPAPEVIHGESLNGGALTALTRMVVPSRTGTTCIPIQAPIAELLVR